LDEQTTRKGDQAYATVRFLYDGTSRLVEPQCYGFGTRGTELLRAHQLERGPQSEPLFNVSRSLILRCSIRRSTVPDQTTRKTILQWRRSLPSC